MKTFPHEIQAGATLGLEDFYLLSLSRESLELLLGVAFQLACKLCFKIIESMANLFKLYFDNGFEGCLLFEYFLTMAV